MDIKQVKKDIIDGKIESFSVLNFYKVVYLNYKKGGCISKWPFKSGGSFVDFVRFLNNHNVKFEPTIGGMKRPK